MISLADYVEQTITQVIEGVQKAQENAKGTGAVVNAPGSGKSEGRFIWGSHDDMPASVLDFDVVLTATENRDTKGGVFVFLAPFALGSKGQSSDSTTSLNRLRFSVPVRLPKGGG